MTERNCTCAEALLETFALKAYVGPCWVKQWADKLRGAGFTSVSEGTEHVYVTSIGRGREDARLRANYLFQRRFGSGSGVRFRAV